MGSFRCGNRIYSMAGRTRHRRMHLLRARRTAANHPRTGNGRDPPHEGNDAQGNADEQWRIPEDGHHQCHGNEDEFEIEVGPSPLTRQSQPNDEGGEESYNRQRRQGKRCKSDGRGR